MNENIGNIENKAGKIIKDLTAENKQLKTEKEQLKQQINIVLRINDKIRRENKLILNDVEYYTERVADLEDKIYELQKCDMCIDCVKCNMGKNNSLSMEDY